MAKKQKTQRGKKRFLTKYIKDDAAIKTHLHQNKIFSEQMSSLMAMRDKAYQEMSARYQSNYILRLDQATQNFLNSLEEGQLQKELDNIDSAVVTKIENAISQSMNRAYAGATNMDVLTQAQQDAHQALMNNSITALNDILGAINKARTVLSEDASKAVEDAIDTLSKPGRKSKKTYTLSEAEAKRVESIISSIRKIYKSMKSGRKPDVNKINGYLNNIFGTNLQEMLLGEIIGNIQIETMKAQQLCAQGLAAPDLNKILVGGSGYFKKGNIDTKFHKQFGNQSTTSKTDAAASMSISTGERNIEIDVGLTIKSRDSKKTSQEVTFAKDTSLERRINQIIGNGSDGADKINLFANAFAAFNQYPEEYEMAKAVLVSRNLDALLASNLGGKDFAQYLVINGEIIPIRFIIKNISNYSGKNTELIHATVDGIVEYAKEVPSDPNIYTPNNFLENRRHINETSKFGNLGFTARLNLSALQGLRLNS